MKKFPYIYFLFVACLLVACSKKENITDVLQPPSLPDQVYNYSQIDLSTHPDLFFETDGGTLEGAVSDEGATLGRVLFYDTKLSATNRISCGSCHVQEAGFSDLKQFSPGFNNQVTTRNSMALSNMIFMSGFFWDLRTSNLNDLVLMPIQNHIEMGMEDIDILVAKLSAVDYYPPLFEAAFGSAEINSSRISEAVAQYLRSMISINAKYDQGIKDNFSNFTPLEELGKTVFFEKGTCNNCHNAPTFDSRWSGSSANIGLDAVYEDPGVHFQQPDIIFPSSDGSNFVSTGHFKIPSLRNIELSPPYMHDGRFNTLEEVVEHYNSGIQNHPSLDWRLRDFDEATGTTSPKRLNLDELEKMALVAFLKTLTDDDYVHDVRFSNPFH